MIKKILFSIGLFLVTIPVGATSLSFSNATAGFSSIQYNSTYGYNYGPYTSHISNNTSFTTTTSNGFTFMTRARLYSYFTSANALSVNNQYTFKYKICTAWTEFNGYFASANIKMLNVASNTAANFDNMHTENLDTVSITRSAVANEPNCSNLIITYRPTTSSIRAIGFWVSFLNFVPNTNTCWVGDCGNTGYNSFSGELLQTYDGTYGNNGYFKFNLSIDYVPKGNNAIIEQNTQTIINQQNQINNSINAIDDSLNNDDTTSEANSFASFFNNFSTDSHGLTGIITAPLNAINSLTSSTCSPLELPLPFIPGNKKLTLPCMRPIYQEHFGAFMTLYDTITFGIVAYWVCVRIFGMVKDFKNPEHDEIEVMDL